MLLSGELVSCDFKLWFLKKEYQINPAKDKYYNLDMDLLDIQKISSIDERKKYTVNSKGRFVAVEQNFYPDKSENGWLKDLKGLVIGITIGGIIIFVCYILGIDL